MKRFLVSLLVALGLAATAGVGPANAVVRSDVSWFQISVNGDIVYGKAYYQVDTNTGRRYVTDMGYRTNSTEGAFMTMCDPANNCWGFWDMTSATSYYHYDVVSPTLSTKNAWVQVNVANEGVWRTASVQLPWIAE